MSNINFAKKPVFKKVNIGNVLLSHDVNVPRFEAGQMVLGITMPDTYDIDQMVTDIVEAGQINSPLTLLNTPEGLVVLQGNRRVRAGQKLQKEPTTSQGLLEHLKAVPAMVYDDLSPEEIQMLVNDQNSKRFTRTGLVNWIWAIRATGKTAQDIVPLCFNQMADWSGSKSRAAFARIENIVDPIDRQKEMRKALKGTLEYEILRAYSLGDEVKKNFLLNTMVGENLKTTEKPQFSTNRAALEKLERAKNADGLAWSPADGGTSFNLMLGKLKEESAKDKPKPGPGSQRPKGDTVDQVFSGFRSKLSRHLGNYLKTGILNGSANLDLAVERLELCSEAYTEIRGTVPNKTFTRDEVIAILDAFQNGDRDIFDATLTVV